MRALDFYFSLIDSHEKESCPLNKFVHTFRNETLVNLTSRFILPREQTRSSHPDHISLEKLSLHQNTLKELALLITSIRPTSKNTKLSK